MMVIKTIFHFNTTLQLLYNYFTDQLFLVYNFVRHTFGDRGNGDSDPSQFRRSCCRPTVLLLCYTSKFQVEKKPHTQAETTLFWRLYRTAHLSPILTRNICRLADFCKLWNRRTCMHVCRKQSKSIF